MRIVRISAQNIKRLKAVEIRPDGAPVIEVSGPNGAGKSSVLDLIAMGLSGEKPPLPIHQGETSGFIEIDLGDGEKVQFQVRRDFTEGGRPRLFLKTPDGNTYAEPTTMLEKIYGKLTLDPLEFMRMTPQQQHETLRATIKLDVDVDALE